MSENKKPKGTWAQRLFIIVLGIILGVLLFWLLNFITKDIGTLPRPELSKVQAIHVDATLVEEQKSLNETLADMKENIRNRQEQRDLLKDSTDNLRNTINQLLRIQKQSLEKGLTLSEQSQQVLAESQTSFLNNQKQYQELNKEIADLMSRQREVEKNLASVSEKIKAQQALAREEYNVLMAKYRWKVASLKLVFLVPIFLIAAWFFTKKRSGVYWPIVYAAFIAVFIQISLVVHEYFPRKYFKYIALLVIIGIVLKLLVHLIKSIIYPKKDWLIKQYQEAYDKCLCPVCGKPIRIGPLRYAVGSRRKALLLVGQGTEALKQQIYACPSCGTQLYEKCDKCSDIRHSLLPFCEHCGAEKTD